MLKYGGKKSLKNDFCPWKDFAPPPLLFAKFCKNHETWKWAFSCRSREMTTTICTKKKRDALANFCFA